MEILKVHFKVPDWIANGMNSGLFTRYADGTIRISPGHEGAGQIVAHLKELDGKMPSMASPIGPESFAGLYVCNFVMMAQLANIRESIKQVQKTSDTILQEVRAIYREVDYAKHVTEGRIVSPYLNAFELIGRFAWANDPKFIHEAEMKIIAGTSETKGFLMRSSPESLATALPFIEHLVKIESTLCLVEPYVALAVGREKTYIDKCLENRIEIIRSIETALGRIKSPTSRFPTPGEVRLQGSYFLRSQALIDHVKKTYRMIELGETWRKSPQFVELQNLLAQKGLNQSLLCTQFKEPA